MLNPVLSIPGKILVVDDDAANRELLAGLLGCEGLEVFTCADGESAFKDFARLSPDLVLMDVKMPGIDGLEVCRRLKKNPETRLTPVILTTGMSAVEDRIAGIAAGADDFLTKPVDRTQLIARVRSLLNLKAFTDELEHAEAVLFALARSIEAKDAYTEGHCQRLSVLSARLGEEIGLSSDEIKALERAGIVHDIGKVAVPDAVLLKPGKLTPEERLIVEQHTILGERICAPLKSFHMVLPIIRHHHEKFDGSGYPDGLVGTEIPILARVLQIIDVHDALLTERPYKCAFSESETIRIMQQEVDKSWWDAEIFTAFQRMPSHKIPVARHAAWNNAHCA